MSSSLQPLQRPSQQAQSCLCLRAGSGRAASGNPTAHKLTFKTTSVKKNHSNGRASAPPLLRWSGKVEILVSKLSLLAEFAFFLREHKKLWLLPIFAALFLIGTLLIAVEGAALSPFIYTLF